MRVNRVIVCHFFHKKFDDRVARVTSPYTTPNMVMFRIEDKHCLKLHMNLYSELIDEYTKITLPLNTYDDSSTVEIAHDAIVYTIYTVFTNMLIKYTFKFKYNGRNVEDVTVVSYMFSYTRYAWIQTTDDEQFLDFIKPTTEHIRAQVKQYFRRIEHTWSDHDYESVTNPYWYGLIKSYEQKCTSKTATLLKQYALHLKRQCDANRHNKKRLERSFFNIWKEWYFSPDNNRGFMNIMKCKYVPSQNYGS